MSLKNAAAGFLGLKAVTGNGAGVGFDVQGCEDFGLQVVYTGGSPTVSVTLEGTIDPPTITDANAKWFTLITWSSGSQSSGDILFATGKPVRRVRANLGTFSGGTNPTLTAKLAAV